MSRETTDERDVEHRIGTLLSDAQAAALSADEDDAAALRDVADGVNFLVETVDTPRLLAATGIDFEDEATPESMPAAIARADSESMTDLRFLLLLSRLSNQEGEAGGALVSAIRVLAETRAEGDETTPEAQSGTDSDEDDPLERFESQIRSRLDEGIDGFREEIETARASLERRMGDEDRAEGDDGDPGEDETEREDGEPADAGRGRRRLSTGGGTGMVSTMPSSNRSDMKTPRRFSTVRKK